MQVFTLIICTEYIRCR